MKPLRSLNSGDFGSAVLDLWSLICIAVSDQLSPNSKRSAENDTQSDVSLTGEDQVHHIAKYLRALVSTDNDGATR